MQKLTWIDLVNFEAAGPVALQILPKKLVERRPPPGEWFHQLVVNFHRIRFIVSSEAKSRIFDKAMGRAWLLLEPLIMAMLYYFITSVVFSFSGDRSHFLYILTAVVFWRWFSRTIDGAPQCILGYGAILKQSRFPVVLVVLGFIATEAFFFLISFSVLMCFLAIFGHWPNWSYLYLPLVIGAQMSLMFFLTLIFSMVGTFIKDLAGVLYAFTSIWWYLSPGIYPVSRIPAKYMSLYLMNPFAHLLPAYRDILIDGTTPPVAPLLTILGVCLLLSFLAARVFRWARYYFFTYL